jgi:hypothetical protein
MQQVDLDMLVECRGCGSVIYMGERNVTIKPGDLIVTLNKMRKGSCPLCVGDRSPKYTRNSGR